MLSHSRLTAIRRASAVKTVPTTQGGRYFIDKNIQTLVGMCDMISIRQPLMHRTYTVIRVAYAAYQKPSGILVLGTVFRVSHLPDKWIFATALLPPSISMSDLSKLYPIPDMLPLHISDPSLYRVVTPLDTLHAHCAFSSLPWKITAWACQDTYQHLLTGANKS